jgi:DNA-binding response OmpR family regulator
VTEQNHTVLIIEDDLDVADMLNAYFGVQGYEVLTVNWGKDGIRAAQTSLPDLIILDIRLPDIEGYEVAEQLRANRRTADIPIIFLTERRQREDRLKGLELGADDYITKPFDIQELRLRVRNALLRSQQGALNNPVTGLAESSQVDEKINESQKSDSKIGLLALSVDNLDRFREDYGFVASDDVLRAVSLMIQNAVRDAGDEDDLVGHLSPTQFIVISQPNAVPAIRERIHTRLAQSLDYFYPLKDRESDAMPEARLAIRMGTLEPRWADYLNGDVLKTALLRTLE